MKYQYSIYAALLASFLATTPLAQADSVAIVLDNSVSMCGYLTKDKTTAYKQLLKSMQDAIQENSDPVSFALLDSVGKQSTTDRNKAMVELDRIVAGVGNDSPDRKKTNPAPSGVGNAGCNFNANNSLLENIFSPSLNNAGLVLLVTDFIFDAGADKGGSASELAFTDNFAQWAQGQPSTNSLKNKPAKTHGKSKAVASSPAPLDSNSSPSSQFQAWSGIIGIRSTFDGKYFLREAGGKNVSLDTDNRPVYLFWRARSPELAERWLKPIMAGLSEKNVHTVAFQLLPSASVIDPRHPTFANRPKSLSAMTNSLKPRVHYVNSRFEEYEKARLNNPKRPPMENPIPASANPANCFKAQGFHVYFDSRCGRGGDRESNFWELQEINEIHIEYPLENELPGLERTYTATPTGFREGSYRVEFKTAKDGAKAVHIALAKIGNKLFEARGNQPANQWSIDLQEQMQVSRDLFDPADKLKEWSSDEEPCENANECKERGDKTVGLVHFVKSLINRSSKIQDQMATPPSTQLPIVRIEFHSVGQLP